MQASLRRPAWAGTLLLATMAAAFVLDFVLMAVTKGPPVIRPDQVGDDLVRVQANHGLWLAEAWTYTLMGVPALLFLVVLHRATAAGRSGLARLGVASLAVFWALHTLHNVAVLAVIQGLAPAYVPGAADAGAVVASARGLLSVGDALNPFAGLGAPFLVLGLVSLARGVGAGAAPRWGSSLAYGAAGLVVVGAFQLVAAPLLAASLLAWVLFMAWTGTVLVGAAASGLTTGPLAKASLSPVFTREG